MVVLAVVVAVVVVAVSSKCKKSKDDGNIKCGNTSIIVDSSCSVAMDSTSVRCVTSKGDRVSGGTSSGFSIY